MIKPWSGLQWHYIAQLARQARESHSRYTQIGGPLEGSRSEERLSREAATELRRLGDATLREATASSQQVSEVDGTSTR